MEIDRQAVRREILLPVDRMTAWDALRDAEGLETWLADEARLEIRRGAQGTLVLRDGERRLVTVEEVEEGRRLTLSWREPDGEPSLVEITLDDVPEGTRLVVVEMPILALRAIASTLEAGCRSGARGPQMLASVA